MPHVGSLGFQTSEIIRYSYDGVAKHIECGCDWQSCESSNQLVGIRIHVHFFNQPFIEYDYNTSQLVRDALPDIIRRSNKRDIRIFKYFRDTMDTYDDVRHVSRDIWSGKCSLFLPKPEPDDKEEHANVDFILHLGMNALRWDPNQFRFETIARRDGYGLPSDDGKFVGSDQLKRLGLPETLSTSLDVNAAWRKVKERYPVSTSL